jgi:hypothetical protein
MTGRTVASVAVSAVVIEARLREGQGWDTAVMVRGRALDSAIRTAARKLGLRGPVLGREQSGEGLYTVNVDGSAMMVSEVRS